MPAPINFSQRYVIAFAVIVCLWSLQIVATAQDKQYTENKPDLAMRSDARIDPSTLAMSLEIPLAGAPGRAGTSLPVALRYSSKVWRINHSQSWWSYVNYHTWTRAKFSENSTAGWTSSLERPRIEFTGMNQLFDTEGNPLNEDPENPTNYGCYVRRINVHLPDGSSHELRKDDAPQCFYLDQANYDFTGTFHAVDGSNMRYDNDAGVLYMPDGGRYFFGSMQMVYGYQGHGLDGRWATSHIDRNGNTLTYNPTTKVWTDTLGRNYGQVIPDDPTVDYPNGGYQYYSIPGFNGQQLMYTLHWARLADVLSNPAEQLRYTSNWDCNTPQSHDEITPYLFLSAYPLRICAATQNGDPALFNPVVLAEVQLPNGRQYQLRYNPWGEIDKVVFPTGGYERYRYDKVATIGDITGPYDEANRGVVERWVSPSGNGSEESTHHWQYSVTRTGGSLAATTTMPNSTRSERSVYVSSTADYGFDSPLAGMTYEERVFNVSNQMLRRTLTEWSLITPPGSGRPRNPHVTKNINLILDTGGNALASTTTFQHDSDLNTTVTSKYDFASVDQTTAQTGAISSILSGALMRTEEATYLVNDTNIDSTTRAAYRARNLLGLVTSARVKNAAGTVVAQSTQSYDEASYPLLTYGAITGWTDPATNVRGNATSSASWLNTTGAWLQTHAQYDQAGSPRNTWDAKGNQSQVEYSSSYAYAYPTLTRSAVPDPSGQYGSNTAFVSTTAYDFNTGLTTSATDANNQTTTLEYATTDGLGNSNPLQRLTRVNRPDGGWTDYGFSDQPGNLFVLTRTGLDASRYTESKNHFDGLGRSWRTEQSEGATAIYADVQYDLMGRAWKSSNPYRVGETVLWATTTFDSLSRATSVTTPDNAVVSTSYSGATVTVTDANGKKRKSVTDGLGRLKEVYEDPTGLNYLTSYSYDTLDNLTSVSQVDPVTQYNQTRSFVYDSLKRLTSATNPESGTVCYGTVTGGQCQANGYDANGNLVRKTDARGIVTTYVYDALNRNTNVNYSDATPDVLRQYDFATSGKGRINQAWQAGSIASATYIDGYDALGRPLVQRQRFETAGVWSGSYQVSRTYDLAGHVKIQTYPSGHTVNYNYDAAGRLGDKDTQSLAFSGNLGDGVTRTYSRGIIYSPLGGITKEQFGTDTPLYNKSFYNSRGQLAEKRVGTYSTDETWWNRGAIINHYSNNCWGMCGGNNSSTAMTDNNGNLKKQDVYIPGNDQITSHTMWTQYFDYDGLNRLLRAREMTGSTTYWQQEYVYDRYGNRTIHQTNTWGGLNQQQFTVNPANNRLGVPTGQSSTMTYDNAGNLTTDTYSGSAVMRAYDAENHMTSETQAGSLVAGAYTYNADGQRVRRTVAGQPSAITTWQVYGMDGELLAEYAQNAEATTPQKEYGYRDGQLLITAEPSTTQQSAGLNVALATNGGTATGSSTLSSYVAANVVDGSRRAINNAIWLDNTNASFPDWVEVSFNGSKTISEIDVVTQQDDYQNPVEPTLSQTFSLYGITAFDVQYWNGSAWVTVTGGSVTGNNKVWRQFSFSPVTTSKIRVVVNAGADNVYSRVVEVEAWEAPPPPVNVALATNGATATASSTYGTQAAAKAIDGDRTGAGYNCWTDNTSYGYPDWHQVDFAGAKTITEIDVFGLQQSTPVEPTLTMTSSYALTSFEVQYWTGSAWATVPGGSVTGNDKVWRKFTFAALTTSKIRVNVTNVAGDNHTQVVEVEAWGSAAGSSAIINWLVTDQLGTPRMVFDQTGALATTKRHDYLPFGEEIGSGAGGRTVAQGYTQSDGMRQRFGGKERDDETGLDYVLARYYSSTQGRFAGADAAGPDLNNPQTLNKYQYALNNPIGYNDRNGLYEEDVHRDLTRVLAYAAGFSMDDAVRIANANQGVDDNPETAPINLDPDRSVLEGIQIRAQYHFTTPSRRANLWKEFEFRAAASHDNSRLVRGIDRDSALDSLGVYFHPAQDAYSHAGFGPLLGHGLAGTAPDKTYNDVGKANEMANSTFNELVLASRLLGGDSGSGVTWSGIKRQVNAFNKARTKREKDKILKQIVTYVDKQRSKQNRVKSIGGDPGPLRSGKGLFYRPSFRNLYRTD